MSNVKANVKLDQQTVEAEMLKLVETDDGKKKMTAAEMEAELIRLRKRLEQRDMAAGSGDPLGDIKAKMADDVRKATVDYMNSIRTKDARIAQSMLFTAVWISRSIATSLCYRGRTLDRLLRQTNAQIKRYETMDAEGSEYADDPQAADLGEGTVARLTAARQRRSELDLDRATTKAALEAARMYHDKHAADLWESPKRGPRDVPAQPGDMFAYGK